MEAFLLQDLVLYKSQIAELESNLLQMENKLSAMTQEKEERENNEGKMRVSEENTLRRIKKMEEAREEEREKNRKEMKILEVHQFY